MTDEKREIRAVLMGRTMRQEDGSLTAIGPGSLFITGGIGDGAGAALFFGIGARTCAYSAPKNTRKVWDAAYKSMQDIGRRVELQTQPYALGCLIRYVLTKPVLLVFKYVDDVPVVEAWAGRGISAWIARRRAIKAFEEGLPESMSRLASKAPDDGAYKTAKREKRRKSRKAKAQEAAQESAQASEYAQQGDYQQGYDQTQQGGYQQGYDYTQQGAYQQGYDQTQQGAYQQGYGYPQDGGYAQGYAYPQDNAYTQGYNQYDTQYNTDQYYEERKEPEQ